RAHPRRGGGATQPARGDQHPLALCAALVNRRTSSATSSVASAPPANSDTLRRIASPTSLALAASPLSLRSDSRRAPPQPAPPPRGASGVPSPLRRPGSPGATPPP